LKPGPQPLLDRRERERKRKRKREREGGRAALLPRRIVVIHFK
jgi:hypothetical protein